MRIRAWPIWRRRRFFLAAAKRFWSFGAVALIPLVFSATATSDFEAWRNLAFGLIALANFGVHVHYEVLRKLREHYWALCSCREQAALNRRRKLQ